MTEEVAALAPRLSQLDSVKWPTFADYVAAIIEEQRRVGFVLVRREELDRLIVALKAWQKDRWNEDPRSLTANDYELNALLARLSEGTG
jgi:hypothetical protein